MTVIVISKKKEFEIQYVISIQSAMEILEILPESMIPSNNGEFVTDN